MGQMFSVKQLQTLGGENMKDVAVKKELTECENEVA